MKKGIYIAIILCVLLPLGCGLLPAREPEVGPSPEKKQELADAKADAEIARLQAENEELKRRPAIPWRDIIGIACVTAAVAGAVWLLTKSKAGVAIAVLAGASPIVGVLGRALWAYILGGLAAAAAACLLALLVRRYWQYLWDLATDAAGTEPGLKPETEKFIEKVKNGNKVVATAK